MKRKPAIDFGGSRPQGLLDDIVRPVIQKGAKKIKNVAFTSNLPKNVRAGISSSARKVEMKTAAKRSSSYWRKAYKANEKMHDALKKDALGRASRQHKKSTVQLAKAYAAQEVSKGSVRKAAKGARQRGGYR